MCGGQVTVNTQIPAVKSKHPLCEGNEVSLTMVGSALNPDNSGRNNPCSLAHNEWKGDVIEHNWSEVW